MSGILGLAALATGVGISTPHALCTKIHLAELRRVMGTDLSTLATRARLDVQVVAEIEARERAWRLDELLAIAFALGITITPFFRQFDPPIRSHEAGREE